MEFLKRFRDPVICIVLLAIPFFFLKANLKDPAQANVFDRVILQVSSPIQYVATRLAVGVSAVWEDYVYLVDTKQDNDRLRSETARLQQENARLLEQAAENRRLRRLLNLREHFSGEALSAEVVAKEISPFFRVVRLRLDRGDRQGVRTGMPVITPDGLVGQIRRAWGRYSDVLLLVDATSAVDVVLERNGTRGVLRGTGQRDRYVCQIEYLLRADEVRVGDTLVTSGFGHRFPPGLRVGRVERVVRREFGMWQEAEVAPAVSFSRLREVLVLTGPATTGAAAGLERPTRERDEPEP